MKIALLGYGKMGKEIEAAALIRNHEIVLRITSENIAQLNRELLQQADVAIEFSKPDCALINAKHCIDAGVPVVIGTTGWYDKLTSLKAYSEEKNASVIFGSNFSIGVNAFFLVNELLAKLMANKPYSVWLEETHHTQKKDKPSGTALTLAGDILKYNKNYDGWSLEEKENKLPIYCERIDEVTGTHLVNYRSEEDTIEIMHHAFNRRGFAAGAVTAAEWIVGKTGFFEFRDILRKEL
ncbi:MAG: 4-hydroxy-tetrahydrodipicolinate reductase [Bacteroidetes bacterium]|jgi:4-hydroxy-tetrahydrodipicolinate reductase|nr:4-hydroxy-tetrahydrodipicolinate reductase [Bacteroidota bacterium]